MIGTKAKTRSRLNTVARNAKRANIQSLAHAGAAIRLAARRGIRRRKKASPAGQPPSTRRGLLRSAILYAVEKQNNLVVIGPEHAKVGKSGSAHEHGGRYKRQWYPQRPFMRPALEKNKDRLPKFWAGSVK